MSSMQCTVHINKKAKVAKAKKCTSFFHLWQLYLSQTQKAVPENGKNSRCIIETNLIQTRNSNKSTHLFFQKK